MLNWAYFKDVNVLSKIDKLLQKRVVLIDKKLQMIFLPFSSHESDKFKVTNFMR